MNFPGQRRGRRRSGRRNGLSFFLGNFYLNLGAQYTTTIVAAVLFAGFVFSGFLLFRYADRDDLLARGRQQMQEGKVAWALTTFQTLVNRYKDSYEGHLELGKVYLAMGDRSRAEKEFRYASSLRSANDASGYGAVIARSKLSISQKRFDDAEKELLAIRKKNPHDREIRDALFELYEAWGNVLLNEDKDFGEAIRRYDRALRYVNDFKLETNLKRHLIETIKLYSGELQLANNPDEVIKMLKLSLKYSYKPETLISIAEAYEKSNRTDDAIEWYRRAFDANPSLISIKLSNMLIEKGRRLLNEKKTEEAEKLFAEADQISRQTDASPDSLYPVVVSDIHIKPDYDYQTGELIPTVTFKIRNDSVKDMNFLNAKVMFYSGNELLTEAIKPIASPESPLMRQGEKNSSTSLTVTPEKSINVHALTNQALQIKIGVAYSEGEASDWFIKQVQEVKIKTSGTSAVTRSNEAPAPAAPKPGVPTMAPEPAATPPVPGTPATPPNAPKRDEKLDSPKPV